MLYKRSNKPGSHWWVRFSVKGEEVRQSSGTDRREAAEAFEQDLRHEIWNQKFRGIVDEEHTWEEACERWLREKSHKRSIERDRLAFRGFAATLAGSSLQDLDRGKIDGLGSSARDRAVIRSVLNACVRWGWLDKAPKVEMPHAEKHDPRWITEAQFERLRRELPPHAQAIASFAVYTGLRSFNIRGLKWSVCDLAKKLAYVSSRDSKSGRAIGVQLSGRAIGVLRGCAGNHPDFVFTDDQGRAPVGSIKTTWAKATKRAGLPGFRFHDLRHTWAAWHTLSGTPPIILKELGGWSSLAMVERYSALNPGHLADWADNSQIKERRRGNSVSKKRVLVDARPKRRAGVSKVNQDKGSGSGARNSPRIRKGAPINKRKS